ncbi:MAG: mevalonate kinase [Archangium sp.]|nr:mevalonate kinase [Archangium sp.]MDP3151388.1 mevalonate kinase [Archangium sp.]MDP3569011.1 mevalonate kinase [Archangium sp.]
MSTAAKSSRQQSHITSFGPGKVILLGEHGVVYGHPALAAAISRGMRAWGVPAQSTSLKIPDGVSPSQQEALERAFARAAKKTKHPKISVHLESELPLSMGLGSSGALAVAVCRVLIEAQTGQPAKARQVEALAFEMEKEFHGTPSGVDHTTSARGTMVLFKQGKAAEVVASKPVKVLVAMVGPRSSTKQTVGALRERQKKWPARYKRVFEQIGKLVLEGASAVRQGELEALGDVMNMNHGMLNALGLSSPPIEEMVARLRGLGALGAKLTGAGGDGGAVIGLFREPEPSVMKLRAQGIDCFASQLAGPGAL